MPAARPATSLPSAARGTHPMKVLALAAYPERIASTRFRVSAFVPHLATSGITVELVPWLDDAAASRLYRRGGMTAAVSGAVHGLARQLRATGRDWDAIWVQREAVLAGPPLVEALARMRGVPLVVDYDDAIWIPQGGPLKRAAKCAWKFDWVLRRATRAIAGSSALAEHARSLGVECSVLPTVVDRSAWTPRVPEGRRLLTIGWIGTHSTAPQLHRVAPALRRLRAEGHAFRVVIIGAGEGFGLDGVETETRSWSQASEIDDFRALDIGLAPMHRSAWHEGKCGFKQVQYMAVGVPCVSSMVGGARDFVVHDENALVADTEDDWYVQLRRLVTDAGLRSRLARCGRELVESRLCTERQAPVLAEILEAAARARTRSV